jgi:hypothetical protein
VTGTGLIVLVAFGVASSGAAGKAAGVASLLPGTGKAVTGLRAVQSRANASRG